MTDRVTNGRPSGKGTPQGRPRVALIVEDRHLSDRAIIDVQAELSVTGHYVSLLVPNSNDLFDIPHEAPTWDAAVSRGRDPAILSLLAAASSLGVLTINTPSAIELVRNKIAMQSILARQGLPVPRAWFAADPTVFSRVPAGSYPLIVKPFDGDGSAGLWLLNRPQDSALLPSLHGGRSLYIAQEYLETGGWDLKLYGIGSDVWAVRKRSPVRFTGSGPALLQAPEAAEPVELDPTLRDIALTCGRACGLELWGVDVALTSAGPAVIEVNDFPTYSAVPDAGERIAHHIATLIQFSFLARHTGQTRMQALVRNPS